ncbi:phospholipid carrier-dependent glycosyltransferase, partial [Candidatus Peregrinibacteria bacterium]|nr:phospholipid carrier-dependent glycosyltransferase [Candidatus Peregrinibacteria bacterium]
ASCAREMLQRGDWVVPWFNGEMFPDKPPLMFWNMMAGFALFGQTEFAARFASAVLGVATALLVFHLGKTLFNDRAGFWAGLATASSIIFTVSARAATVDTALTFVITLALAAFVWGMRRRTGSMLDEDGPIPWPWALLIYAATGISVLGKGPVGAIMPLGVIGMFLLVQQYLRSDAAARPKHASSWLDRAKAVLTTLVGLFSPKNFAIAIWRMRPFTAVVVLAAVIAPWTILVYQRTDGAWIHDFLWKYNLGPSVKPILGHTGPFFYHIISIMIGFFPWAVFLTPMFIHLFRRFRAGAEHRDGYVLLACWIGVIVGLWSAVAMKLPHYVLPAYPALALLLGGMIATWLETEYPRARYWMRNAMVTNIVIGLLMAVGFPIAAWFFLPGEWWLGMIGVILIIGGAVCLRWSNRGELARAFGAYAVMSVVFLTAIFGFATMRIALYRNAPSMTAQLREMHRDGVDLVSFRFLRQGFVFYGGKPVPKTHHPWNLRQTVEASKRPYVLTLDEHVSALENAYPGRFETVLEQKRFLESGKVVILRPKKPAARTAATESSKVKR